MNELQHHDVMLTPRSEFTFFRWISLPHTFKPCCAAQNDSPEGAAYPWRSPRALRFPCRHWDVNPLTSNTDTWNKKRRNPGAQAYLSSNKTSWRETVRLTSVMARKKQIWSSSEFNKRAMITISVCHRVHTGRLTSHTRGLTGGGQYVGLTLSLEEQQKEMFTTYRQEEAAVRSVPCESQWLMSANRTEETTEWEWLFPVIRKSEGDLSRNGLVDNKNTRKWTLNCAERTQAGTE